MPEVVTLAALMVSLPPPERLREAMLTRPFKVLLVELLKLSPDAPLRAPTATAPDPALMLLAPASVMPPKVAAAFVVLTVPLRLRPLVAVVLMPAVKLNVPPAPRVRLAVLLKVVALLMVLDAPFITML